MRPSSRTRERAPVLTPEERKRQAAGDTAKRKGWGSVARKGAINITSTGHELDDTKSRARTPEPVADWEEVARAPRTPAPSKTKTRAPYALPSDVAADVRKVFIGTAYMREKMVFTLTRAAEAYDRKRYEEALRLGRIVADATPGVAAVRELTGLAAYRADRWAMAKIHLRAYFTITEDPEHLPLVMDADRANHRYRAVEKTFEELNDHEATPEVLAEGRIVMAATWADQRKYDEAIELLTRAGATKNLRNPSYRHVRLWYALADVFDRAGDTASARELFARIVLAEPDAYDAAYRLEELGATLPRKNRKRRVTPTSKKNLP
ncbi:MAG TPA: tetratricopeptide repeat protein [Acidimicrobiales bacterium]